VTGERWIAVSQAVTGRFALLSTGTFGALAAVAVAAACFVALLVRRMLPRFPARVVRADSARAGTTLMAAAFLNVPLLTWIAEDSHWRGRLLASRPWPALAARSGRLSPAFTLAWADWRRLARRPAVLTALAVSTLAPALAGTAFTGELPGWLWPLLGLAAGPGEAAAALRIARTAPINPADQGPDTPLGPTPPWLITRAGSVLVGLAGAYPTLNAVRAGHLHGGTLAAQLAVSAAVLGVYILLVAFRQAPRVVR